MAVVHAEAPEAAEQLVAMVRRAAPAGGRSTTSASWAPWSAPTAGPARWGWRCCPSRERARIRRHRRPSRHSRSRRRRRARRTCGPPRQGDKRTRDLLAAPAPAPACERRRPAGARCRSATTTSARHGLLADLPIGEEATLVVTVEGVRVRPTRRRNLVIVEARVRDESGPGVLVWFNQRYLAKQLQPGMRLSVRGERRGTIGAEIVAKRHELLGATTRALPHLRAGARLPLQREAHQPPHRATWCTAQLGHVGDAPDALPSALRSRRGLPLRRDALLAAHRPRHARRGPRGRAAARVRGAVPAAGRADQPPPANWSARPSPARWDARAS